MTIHRDLTELAQRGMVRRTRGSVSAEKSLLFESSYLLRARQNIDEKRRLAQAAVRLLEPGNAVMWDDSSTAFQMCDFLDAVTPLTVLTNARPVLERLHDRTDIDLIALGGRYHRGYDGFFGMACERAIRSYHVDVVLMSSTTVQGLSLYTQDEQVVRAKRAMIEVARRKVLMVDSSKFRFSALIHVAELTEFDAVLVPATLEEAAIARMRDAGVKLIVV
jgi:DeoR/GlpR family transcriptional regulator of sugar metabolism